MLGGEKKQSQGGALQQSLDILFTRIMEKTREVSDSISNGIAKESNRQTIIIIKAFEEYRNSKSSLF